MSTPNALNLRTRLRGPLLVLVLGVATSGFSGCAQVGNDGSDAIAIRQVTSTSTTTSTTPPTAAALALADRTAMSPAARNVFFSTGPEVVNKALFGERCELQEEVSVLGCFHEDRSSGQPRISLLAIDDPRLDGMEEVTAAHEMLHAVWARLDARERRTLTVQLQTALSTVTDQRLLDKVESYRSRDPEVVPNELHSILGTEVAGLSPELERHYAKWFVDRSAVTTLAARSQSVFDALMAQVDAFDAQLVSMSDQISALGADLEAQKSSIDSERARIEALLDAGDVERHNQAIPSFNRRVETFNAASDERNRLIDLHNTIVAERNAIASQYREISETIRTSSSPPAEPSAPR